MTQQALEIATINGARALGLENEIGSIEISKSSDLIAIDIDRLETMPVNDLFSNIVYATGRDQQIYMFWIICRITHVWVNGKCLLDNQRLTTIDINECFTKSQYWMRKLREDNPYYQNQSNNLASSPFQLLLFCLFNSFQFHLYFIHSSYRIANVTSSRRQIYTHLLQNLSLESMKFALQSVKISTVIRKKMDNATYLDNANMSSVILHPNSKKA